MAFTAFAYFLSLGWFFYTCFQFKNSHHILPILLRFIHNLCRGLPANNDTVEFYGDSIHNISIRIISILFLFDSGLPEEQYASTVEWLAHLLTQNQYMSRIMVSGDLDFRPIQVFEEVQVAFRDWQMDKEQSCPREFANLMEAIAWAVFHSAGFAALVDHYQSNLHPAMDRALRSFHHIWSTEGPQSFLSTSQARWDKRHSGTFQYDLFKARIASETTEVLEDMFQPLTDILSLYPPSFTPDGELTPGLLYLADLGFDLYTCLFRQTIDAALPDFRVSEDRGAQFGSLMCEIVLSDSAIACVFDNASVYTFPPAAGRTQKAKAQVFCIAVALLYAQDPLDMDDALSLPLTALTEVASQILRQ
ncbi:hypothetical protein ONZ45_g15784 [Pleurotus djamor]|nr:hypothetical protein ONZ45_g15784 [Pleurotus djamor]